MKRARQKQVDRYPCFARGETEFEEKHIEVEFAKAFDSVAALLLSDLRGTYEYIFRSGYVTGKNQSRLNTDTIQAITKQ